MFTASSMYNRYYGPWSSRLQARNRGATRGGWLAKVNNNRQWLQIDLGAKSVVKRIATQARYDANQWVTSYTVSYSNNGVRFYPYRENRKTRVCCNFKCFFQDWQWRCWRPLGSYTRLTHVTWMIPTHYLAWCYSFHVFPLHLLLPFAYAKY